MSADKTRDMPTKELILELLTDEVEQAVKNDIARALKWRNLVKHENFPAEPIDYIAQAIITRSFWREWPIKHIKEKLNIPKSKPQLITHYDELPFIIQVVESLQKPYWTDVAIGLRAFNESLHEAKSLKKWLKEAYQQVKNNPRKWKQHPYFQKLRGVALKGISTILRDLGYFDVIPVDLHIRRFVDEHKINLYYKPPNASLKSDLCYIKSLEQFCKNALHGVSLEVQGENFPLDKNPGIVDLIVWHHKHAKCK